MPKTIRIIEAIEGGFVIKDEKGKRQVYASAEKLSQDILEDLTHSLKKMIEDDILHLYVEYELNPPKQSTETN